MRAILTLVVLLLAPSLAGAEAEAPPLDAAAEDRACRDGSGEACARLGRALRFGTEGVPADLPRAREVFERACALGKGKVAACVDFAGMVLDGVGGPRIESLARVILTRACDGKVGYACKVLGLIYVEGLGVSYGPENQKIGAGYYRKACDLGWADGCSHLEDLYKSGVGVKKDLATARALRRKACRLDPTLCRDGAR